MFTNTPQDNRFWNLMIVCLFTALVVITSASIYQIIIQHTTI